MKGTAMSDEQFSPAAMTWFDWRVNGWTSHDPLAEQEWCVVDGDLLRIGMYTYKFLFRDCGDNGPFYVFEGMAGAKPTAWLTYQAAATLQESHDIEIVGRVNEEPR